MIGVLVIEDDFRVARIHAEVARRVPGLDVVGLAHTASAGITAAERLRPNLVLLDLYLPDAGGLDVLRRLRALGEPPDVMMLTAARDMDTVRQALAGGAIQFLIKPFDVDDLRRRLARYAEVVALSDVGGEVDQPAADRLFEGLRPRPGERTALPKGYSSATADLVLRALSAARGALSAAEVADRTGISRPTAQRYLATLAGQGRVDRSLRYGHAGRPEHRYVSL